MKEVKKSKKRKENEGWKQFQAKSLYQIENIYYNWRQFAQLKHQKSISEEDYLKDIERHIALELEALGNEIFNYLYEKPSITDFLPQSDEDVDNLYAHVFRVAIRMGLIALKENYNERQIKHGIMGSLIHDFGLVIEKPSLSMDYWIEHKVRSIQEESYWLGQRYLEMNTEICPEIKCILKNPQFSQKSKEQIACSLYRQCLLGRILWHCDALDYCWIGLKKSQASDAKRFQIMGHCS